MRKFPKLLILLLSGALLASCNGSELPFEELPADESGIDTPFTDYSVPVSKISFTEDEKSIVLNKGETHTYTYSLEPKRAESKGVKWISENQNIATIDDGKLTAVGGGKTVIRAESPDDTFTPVKLNVEVVVPIVDFTLEDTIHLGYAKSHTVGVTFDPIDTTQNELTYESSNTDVVTVSESGEITSLLQDGYADIKVHSKTLNTDKYLRVNVSEPHLTAITLDKSVTEVEVDHTLQMHATLTPADAYEQRYVYSIDEASIIADRASISESGVLTAKEAGTVTVTCTSVALPNIHDEFDVEIIQYTADHIEVDDIEISNQLTTYQIDPRYVDSSGDPATPSRKNLSFTSSDENVATVSESGLVTFVGKGTAHITVQDTLLTGVKTADVEVTARLVATAVTISGATSVYIGDSTVLTVSSTPARDTLSDTSISVEATGGREAASVDDSELISQNKITVTGVAAGAISLVVTVGGVRSNVYTISVSNKPFLQGKAYLVGDRNYSSGHAQAGDSWDNAGQAFEMEEVDPEAGMISQFRAKGVYFTTDSLWKIRVNAADWLNFDDENGNYQTDAGAFVAEPAQMVVDINEQGYKNVKATVAGYYDIYYKLYGPSEYRDTNYWQVYIEKTPTLSLSATEIYVVKDGYVDIEAHHYTGDLAIVSASTGTATAAQQGETNVIRVEGVAKGNTTITVTDELSNEATCIVHVRNRVFEDNKAYICGEKDYSSGTSAPGESWSDADQAFYMGTDVSSLYENEEFAWRGQVTFAENDVFKVRYGQVFKNKETWVEDTPEWRIVGKYNLDEGAFATHDMGFTNDGDENVIVKTPGTYYVDYIWWNNTGHTEGWYEVRIYAKPVMTLDQSNVAVAKDANVIINASNNEGAISATPVDSSVAIASVSGTVITITGKAVGSTTVNVTDGVTNIAVGVTVSSTVDPSFQANTIYVVGNKDYSSGVSVAGASWDDSNKAYNIGLQDEDIDQDAFIHFYNGDEWKVRVGDDYIGDYNLCDGMDQEPGQNVVVSDPGWYRVIFHYNTSESHRYVTVTQFAVDATELNISVGGTATFHATNYKLDLTAVSSNESIATVSSPGYEMTVTGVAAGSATITVTDGTGTYFEISVVVTNTYTIYFSGSNNAFKNKAMFVHYWGSSQSSSSWPGYEMTWVRNDEYGNPIFVCQVPNDIIGLLFHTDDGYQTVDITTGFGNEVGFYIPEGAWIDGKAPCVPW